MTTVAPGPKGPTGNTGAKGQTGDVGVKGQTGDVGPTGPGSGRWTAQDYGLLCWTFDPAELTSNQYLLGANLFFTRIRLPYATSVAGVAVGINVVAAGLTPGQSYCVLYRDDTGALVGQTADTSADWMANLGIRKHPLTGGPYALPAGYYRAGVSINGTTGPNFLRQTSGIISATEGMTVKDYRANYIPLAGTAPPPATFPANPFSSNILWFGLY